jgi:hypothetical protein
LEGPAMGQVGMYMLSPFGLFYNYFVNFMEGH